MNQRPKEANDPMPQPPVEDREGASGSYYYDDGTGYEIYTPDEDEDGEETMNDE